MDSVLYLLAVIGFIYVVHWFVANEEVEKPKNKNPEKGFLAMKNDQE